MTSPTRPLNDGRTLPAIGLGTDGLRGDDGAASVVSALAAGYRLLDTALNYENEREVGEGVRASPVDRADVSVTTKLPGRHHGFDATLRSFEESLPGLGLDYVDLYLIHWPLPAVDKYVDSWRAMIRLREEGVVREGLVTSIAETHGVTPSQVVLRWHLQLGAVAIPKSADELRQRENLDVFRFELSDAEVEAISTLESGRLWDADPETPEEF